MQDLPEYIPERLLRSTLFCDNFLKLRVIFVKLLHMTVACHKTNFWQATVIWRSFTKITEFQEIITNSLDKNLLNVGNKKCKAMRTLLYCIYYDGAGENISLVRRHLVLRLLASSYNKFWFDGGHLNI